MDKFPETDQTLIDRICRGGAGRKQALAMIYTFPEWRKTVFLKVMEKGGDEEQAVEVMAETLIILDRQIRDQKFKGKSNLFTYSIGIAKFTWWGMRRKRIKEQQNGYFEPPPETEAEEPERSQEQQELWEILEQVLRQIGDPCQTILMLWSLDYPSPEIARTMDYIDAQGREKTKYVNKMVYRCKRRLSKMVSQDPDSLEKLEPFWQN